MDGPRSFLLEDAQHASSLSVLTVLSMLRITEEENLSAAGLLVQQLQTVQWIEENHTGQHHRNTTISIPTAAGQPVRG